MPPQGPEYPTPEQPGYPQQSQPWPPTPGYGQPTFPGYDAPTYPSAQAIGGPTYPNSLPPRRSNRGVIWAVIFGVVVLALVTTLSLYALGRRGPSGTGSAGATATTVVTTAPQPTATSQPTATAQPIPSPTPTGISTTALNGTWIGQGTYNNGQTPFDMTLTLTVVGSTFTGTLEEKIYSSTVAVQGTIVGSSGSAMTITFTDNAAISGNQITLNCTYNATVSNGHMNGTWAAPGDSTADGAITLNHS